MLPDLYLGLVDKLYEQKWVLERDFVLLIGMGVKGGGNVGVCVVECWQVLWWFVELVRSWWE